MVSLKRKYTHSYYSAKPRADKKYSFQVQDSVVLILESFVLLAKRAKPIRLCEPEYEDGRKLGVCKVLTHAPSESFTLDQ